ncbi:hypothetical protein E2C01_067831 [Portunus trituberculatus]|uniref:Uncharacterized protein n=1 Tax=Portunus trituberculatus TaxID=210409 RepID=A0A5B7HUR4_PORTR|nr:hypothetical protein [Portunus trituberculatus]
MDTTLSTPSSMNTQRLRASTTRPLPERSYEAPWSEKRQCVVNKTKARLSIGVMSLGGSFSLQGSYGLTSLLNRVC